MKTTDPSTTNIPPAEGALTSSSVTAKGLLVGAICSGIIGAGVVYADNTIRGSYLALDFASPTALVTLFFLALLLNPILSRLRRTWALSTADVAVVYIMALMAASLPSMGLTGFLLSYLTGAQYYSTAENEWAELFLRHVPEHLLVLDPEAVQHFYEGNPVGAGGIPWNAWIVPLLAWGIFLGVLYLVMIAVMVILRRQWMDHERLLYPLMQPSLMLIERPESARFPPIFRAWLFWVGVGVPILIGAVNGLHAYYEFIPKITLEGRLLLFRNTTTLRPTLSFATLGFTYFLSQDISLGIWVFNLLAKMQEGTFNVLGIASTETMEWVSVPLLAHQALGAMVVLVLWGLWAARVHLRLVWTTAWSKAGHDEDADEVMSYRAAVLAVLAGFPFMAWWLWLSGMTLWIAFLTLAVGFVLFIGLTRMVTEGGFFITRAPINPGNAIISGFGVEALGTSGTTAMGYTFVWAGEMRLFVMASCANALRIAAVIDGRRRILLWAMLAALAISAISSIWMELTLCYRHGGINLSTFHTALVHYPFNFISRNLNNATAIDWTGWAWTGWGGVLMAGLMWARQRFIWWPVHPISLPVSSMWMTDTIVLSVFLSWLLKLLLLKYGGPTLYQRGKPLFIGLIIGQYSSMTVWVLIDSFTGMTDNLVWWL